MKIEDESNSLRWTWNYLKALLYVL